VKESWIVTWVVSIFGVCFGSAVCCGGAILVGRDGGPAGIMVVASLAAIAFGGMGLTMWRVKRDEALLGIAIGVVTIVVSATVTLPYQQALVDARVQQCEKLVYFGMSNFERLDTNNNGDIEGDELTAAKRWLELSDEQRQIVDHMMSNISYVGHVTKSTLSPLWVEGAPNDVEYGISRKDLSTYGERLLQKDKNWLKK
jgi:hypothetical protein